MKALIVAHAREQLNDAWAELRTLDDREHARWRFFEIMRRHIEASDVALSDHALVATAVNRYNHWRGVPLIDPNE